MSLLVLESLRDIFNELKSAEANDLIRDEFKTTVSKCNSQWSKLNMSDKEKVVFLIAAIYSKVRGELPALVDLYQKAVFEVTSESCLILGILLCSYLPKESLKKISLHSLDRTTDNKQTAKVGDPDKKEKKLEKDLKVHIPSLIKDFRHLILKEDEDLNFSSLLTSLRAVNDVFCLSAFFNSLRELIFLKNREPLTKNSLTSSAVFDIAELQTHLIQKIYKVKNDRPLSELNEKVRTAVSQSYIEIVFLGLRVGEGYNPVYELSMINQTSSLEILVNLICAKMCSQVKDPTFVDLLESLKLGIKSLDTLACSDSKHLAKIVGIMALNFKNYSKIHKIEVSQINHMKHYVFKLLELTHHDFISINYEANKEIIFVAYKMMQQLMEDYPTFLSEELIDQLMTQNCKRKCKRTASKEIEIIQWLIHKILTDKGANNLLNNSDWPSFFMSVFNYIKTFDPRYRLGLQLSSLELLTSVAQKLEGSYSSMKLELVFAQFKTEIETSFESSSSTDFTSMLRYLNYRLSTILIQSKEIRSFDLEVSLRIKDNLKEVESLLIRESKGGLTNDHSISLLKAMSDNKTLDFVKRIADDSMCIRALESLGSISRLHHCYSLEALLAQCHLVLLLFEEHRIVAQNGTLPEMHNTMMLSLLCRYSLALKELGSQHLVSWVVHSVRFYKNMQSPSDKLGAYLFLSAQQDIKELLRTFGKTASSRYDIELEADLDKTVIEAVSKNKSCVKHFISYIRLLEDRVVHSVDPYSRAACIKELVNSVACLKEQIQSNAYADIQVEQSLEFKTSMTRSLFLHITDSNMYYSEMSIVFRRILQTTFDSAYQMTMFNYCDRANKLFKSLSMITQSIEDHISYLHQQSLIRVSDFSTEAISEFFMFFEVDIASCLALKTSWKNVLDEKKQKLAAIFEVISKSYHGRFTALIATVINDSQNKKGRPICRLLDVSIGKESLLLDDQEGDSIESTVYRSNLEYLCRQLDPLYRQFVDVVFRGSNISTTTTIMQSQLDRFGQMLGVLLSEDSINESLKSKQAILETIHLNLLTAFFSRIDNFNLNYELIVGKTAQHCYWTCIKLGLFSLSRYFLDLIVHFIFCFNQDKDRKEKNFWLPPQEVCKMVQVACNPSYDIKRFIKLISLDLVKKRESYGRLSLRRLTMRRADSIKEFYKYSVLLKGSLIETLYRENLSAFKQDPSTPILIISRFSNILDSLNRSNQIPLLCRFDCNQWTYSVKSPQMSANIDSIIELLNDNEVALREASSSENIVARDWWMMRNRFDSDLLKQMEKLEDSLDVDVLMFDHRLTFSSSGCADPEDVVLQAELRILNGIDPGTLTSNHLKSLHQINTKCEDALLRKATSTSQLDRDSSKRFLLLLIDGPSFTVPFEHLPSVSDLKSQIYRIPHISESSQKNSISKVFKVNKYDDVGRNMEEDFLGLDAPKCYYLLNPSGDLKGTENRIKDYLEKKLFQWKGKIGKEPKASEIAAYLKKNCHFL